MAMQSPIMDSNTMLTIHLRTLQLLVKEQLSLMFIMIVFYVQLISIHMNTVDGLVAGKSIKQLQDYMVPVFLKAHGIRRVICGIQKKMEVQMRYY